MRASTNPITYCEGGFYGGHLKPEEKIKSILKPMTYTDRKLAIKYLKKHKIIYKEEENIEDED